MLCNANTVQEGYAAIQGSKALSKVTTLGRPSILNITSALNLALNFAHLRRWTVLDLALGLRNLIYVHSIFRSSRRDDLVKSAELSGCPTVRSFVNNLHFFLVLQFSTDRFETY